MDVVFGFWSFYLVAWHILSLFENRINDQMLCSYFDGFVSLHDTLFFCLIIESMIGCCVRILTVSSCCMTHCFFVWIRSMIEYCIQILNILSHETSFLKKQNCFVLDSSLYEKSCNLYAKPQCPAQNNFKCDKKSKVMFNFSVVWKNLLTSHKFFSVTRGI